MSEQQDKIAYRKMEKYIKDKKIFVDTCSLMFEHASEFFDHFIPVLKKQKQKVIVPLRCIEEAKKFTEDTDVKRAEMGKQAVAILAMLQRNMLLDIRGEKTDGFADNVFLVQFTKYRMSYRLLLITQDRTLGKEILALNDSKAAKGHKISVLRINKYGFLSKHECEEIYNVVNDEREEIIEKFELGNKVTTISKETMDVSYVPGESEAVISSEGKQIILTKEVGSGGEGTIFETDCPYVAKIYKDEKITARKYAKLQLMISKKVECPGVCYPTSLLYNLNKEFVGYLMPKAKGIEIQRSIFIKPLLKKNFPNWKKKDTVKLCITILKKIKYLNDRNIILGDINPANILVVSPEEVYFVDADSYQVGEFPCPVGMVNYTAPEIQKKSFSDFLRTQGHENFAIATLLFMIMIPGKSPYAQQGGEDPVTNIIKMDFSYPFGDNSNKKTPDGPWRFIWSHLTYELKGAFYNTFRKEGEYASVNNRLDADDWLKIFNKYYGLLDSGAFGEQDKMSEELFPTRFKNVRRMYA